MNAVPNPAEGSPLAGLRVLVVEDMFLIAEDIADQLSGWGCEVVGPDGHVKGALRRIADSKLDGALLDVNLDGETSFEIAAVLSSKNVPFIFLTGYDRETAFPREFQEVPKLGKPVASGALHDMIERHFAHPARG